MVDDRKNILKQESVSQVAENLRDDGQAHIRVGQGPDYPDPFFQRRDLGQEQIDRQPENEQSQQGSHHAGRFSHDPIRIENHSKY